MSIATEIHAANKGVIDSIQVNKHHNFYGQNAIEVVVHLTNGVSITGEFATESKEAFGGVAFSQQKDIAALMNAKIKAVLNGVAEL